VSAEGKGVQYMRSSPFVAEIAGRCHGAWIRGACFRFAKVENLFRLRFVRGGERALSAGLWLGRGICLLLCFTSLCFLVIALEIEFLGGGEMETFV
jgi:hypothetical protein